MEKVRLGLMAALALLLMPGCVPVPFYTPTTLRAKGSARGPISPAAMAFLTTGTTTRTEVLLRLGVPDEVQNDDRQFVYSWGVEVAQAGLVILSIVPNAVGAASSAKVETHRLFLEFDETGILRKRDYQITAQWQ